MEFGEAMTMAKGWREAGRVGRAAARGATLPTPADDAPDALCIHSRPSDNACSCVHGRLRTSARRAHSLDVCTVLYRFCQRMQFVTTPRLKPMQPASPHAARRLLLCRVHVLRQLVQAASTRPPQPLAMHGSPYHLQSHRRRHRAADHIRPITAQ